MKHQIIPTASREVPNPAYNGQVRLVNWNDGNHTGMWAKFRLQSLHPEDIHPFRGCFVGKARGQRLRVVFLREDPMSIDVADEEVILVGDAMLMHWDETPYGMCIKLGIDDGIDGHREHPFKGMTADKDAGEVLRMVAWFLGDDEELAAAPLRKRKKTPFHQLDTRRQVIITCNTNTDFHDWLEARLDKLMPDPSLRAILPSRSEDSSAFATEVVKSYCHIDSRRVFDEDSDRGHAAREAWQQLFTAFNDDMLGRH